MAARVRWLFLAAVVTVAPITAQPPRLVTDLRTEVVPGPLSSWPRQFAGIGGQLIFSASGDRGREVYRTDGSAAGTERLRDVFVGVGSSEPAWIVRAGSLVFFAADDGEHGAEPWITDGTVRGTRLLRDIVPGPDDSSPYGPVVLDHRIAFEAGGGLWVSDGTPSGTFDLRNSPNRPSFFRSLFAYGGRLYFSATDVTHGVEPWVSDGTLFGTSMLRNIADNRDSTPFFIGAAGSNVYFTAHDGTARMLWKTDGTGWGTDPVASVIPSLSGAVGAIGDRFLFDDQDTRKLWRTDGTAAGTVVVADVRIPRPVAHFGGEVYFIAGSASGRELYRTDGTAAGTTLVYPVTAGAAVELGGVLLFGGDDGTTAGLWRTDGTAAGTWNVRALDSVRDLTRLGDAVVFGAGDGVHGDEPWITDGSTAGTRLLVDLETRPAGATTSSRPHSFVVHDGQGYFMAAAERFTEHSLWKTDGSAAGTVLVEGFSTYGFGVNPADEDLMLLVAGPNLYTFRAWGEAEEMVELWGHDGDRTTHLATAERFSYELPWAAVGDRLYLGLDVLWTSDGTVAGTHPARSTDPNPLRPTELTPVGDRLFFIAYDPVEGLELWVIERDATTMTRVAVLIPGLNEFSNPHSLTAAAGRLFFVVDDGVHGAELWVSDGTTDGTRLVTDLTPGPAGGRPTGLTALGRDLLFAADDGRFGRELWRTDGSALGTRRMADVAPGAAGSGPREIVALEDRVLFSADDGLHGRELWSVGPASAPPLLYDLVPGPESSLPELVRVGDEVYATTDDGTQSKLWRTDGTVGRTVELATFALRPEVLRVTRDRVLFRGYEAATGWEPWTLEPGAVAAPIGQGCGRMQRAAELAADDPVIGSTMRFSGRSSPVGAFGLLTLSGVARPMSVGGGCVAYVDPSVLAILTPITVVGDTWSHVQPVPNLSALQGISVVAQAWFAPSPNPIGFEASNGVYLTFGW